MDQLEQEFKVFKETMEKNAEVAQRTFEAKLTAANGASSPKRRSAVTAGRLTGTVDVTSAAARSSDQSNRAATPGKDQPLMAEVEVVPNDRPIAGLIAHCGTELVGRQRANRQTDFPLLGRQLDDLHRICFADLQIDLLFALAGVP